MHGSRSGSTPNETIVELLNVASDSRKSVIGPLSLRRAGSEPAKETELLTLPRRVRAKTAVALACFLIAEIDRTAKHDSDLIKARKRPAASTRPKGPTVSKPLMLKYRAETPFSSVMNYQKGSIYCYHERAAKINQAAKTHKWLHSPVLLEGKPLRWKCSRCEAALQTLSGALPIYRSRPCCGVGGDPPPLAVRISTVDDLQLIDLRAKWLLRRLRDAEIATQAPLRQSAAFEFVCECGWRVPRGSKRPWLMVDAHRAAHGLPPAVRPARGTSRYLGAANAASCDLAQRIAAAWEDRKPSFAHQLDGQTRIIPAKKGSEAKKFQCSKCDRWLAHPSARIIPCFAAAGFASIRHPAYVAAYGGMIATLRERWQELKAEHVHASRAAYAEVAKSRLRGPQVPRC